MSSLAHTTVFPPRPKMPYTHVVYVCRTIENLVFEIMWARENTVNSDIFARVLFSRNFAYAKFRENKILAKCRNHSVVY